MTNYLQKGTLGEPQVRAERRNGWTKSRRDAFLNHLSMTCNVDQSCAAVGMSDSSAYQLRRPEHDLAWCDELAKWRRGEATWDNLQMGLRGGDRPRTLVTTTPRPGALLKRVQAMAEASGTLVRGATRDNVHLPPSFVAAMVARYGGRRCWRRSRASCCCTATPMSSCWGTARAGWRSCTRCAPSG